MANRKYWIALGEHPMFTRDDNHIFYAFPAGQPGSGGTPLQAKFVDAIGLEEARARLHAFIDERLDHEIHMAKLEKEADKISAKREKFKASTPVADSDVNSLSIGGFVNEDPKAAKSNTAGLLDLETLL